MGEMRWVQELTTEEKQVWLNLGIDMVKQVKPALFFTYFMNINTFFFFS